MKNFVQPGKGLTFTAPYAVSSGDAFKVGNYIAVASGDAASGDPVEGELEGVYSLKKATGTAWTQGDALYWNDSDKDFTKTGTSATLAGFAAADAGSGDAVGNVHLMPGIGAALAIALAADA
jgi:predicted RecA/RadA family phage recombinase